MGDVTMWRRLLNELNTASRPLTSFELAERLGIQLGRPRAYRQSAVNTDLQRLAARGFAQRGPDRLSRYHNVPSYTWEPTDAGRLVPFPPPLPQYKAARAQRVRENLARRNLIAGIVASRPDWGPRTPIPERQEAVRFLRSMGATLQECGDAFGRTRQMALFDERAAGLRR
jgi:hypothetical protein